METELLTGSDCCHGAVSLLSLRWEHHRGEGPALLGRSKLGQGQAELLGLLLLCMSGWMDGSMDG